VVPQQLAHRDPAGTATVARPRRAVRLAWVLLGLTVLLLAATLVIAFTGGETWNAKLATTPVALAFAVVGALIAARTGNRLGWLFLAAGAVASLSLVMEAYAARVPAAALPGAAWVGWSFVVVLGIEGPLFFLTLLLFPDGRPPSRWWWPVVWLAIIGGIGQVVCAALSDVGFSSNFPRLRDPVTVVAPLTTPYNQAQEAGLVVLLAGVAAMIVRFRRSGTEQRLQLKWVMYASAVAAVAVLGVAQFSNDPLPEFAVFFPLIPAGVGIAILRYRLYAIDRLISRTLAYAIVTGLLVGVYAVLVLVATQVLRFRTPVAVAAATLAAAALFSPLRQRVQQMVDRRFNRVRYDADQTVAAFAGRLREAVDLDTLRADLLAVVDSAVEPAHSSVWIASHRPGPSA
jgi:MFS family permease